MKMRIEYIDIRCMEHAMSDIIRYLNAKEIVYRVATLGSCPQDVEIQVVLAEEDDYYAEKHIKAIVKEFNLNKINLNTRMLIFYNN